MRFFTDNDVWSGGFYELALEYGRSPDRDLSKGMLALWAHDTLEGCYLDCNSEPDTQQRLQFEPSLIERGHLYGVADLPSGKRIACGTCSVREDHGSDWLVFYCPMSALGRVYSVGGFPFDGIDHDHEQWRVPVDNWLANISRTVFERARFRLGLIGWEISGEVHADDLLISGIPNEHDFGFLLPTEGELVYFPRTASSA